VLRRALVSAFIVTFAGTVSAQDFSGIQFHGFVTQGFVYSSHNNYLTMQTSSGSLQWTEGAFSISDSLSDNLRVGIQLHMYQLGQLGGPNVHVDWALGDYRVNDYLGFRGGKVKTVMGLFNDSQDVDAIFLWTLLPQCSYPVDNEGYFLSHLGGEVYGYVPLGKRAGKLRYDGYAGHSYLPLDEGYIKQLTDAGLIFTNEPTGKTYGGDVRWETPLQGLLVGYSPGVLGLSGAASGGSMNVPTFYMSAQYAQFARGKFFFAGEYDKSPYNEMATIGQEQIFIPVDEHDWYVMGSYRLTKRLQVGSYYSHYMNKALDTSQPANYSKDFVLSERYDFNSYFYAKIEDHFLHGTGLGYYESTNPNGLQPNSNILAAKIGFSF
jgi:hypothetical protein